MSITYRRLLPADAAAYRPLRLECLREFPYHFGAVHAEEAARPKLWMEEQIEAQSAEVFMVGAYDEGKLIGFCGITRDPASRRRHIARVIQMYVQATYTGRKIGLGLMQATIAEAWRCADLEQLVLEVASSNQGAVRVYAQAGFEQYGFHKDYMKEGTRYEDAYLMVLFRGKA